MSKKSSSFCNHFYLWQPEGSRYHVRIYQIKRIQNSKERSKLRGIWPREIKCQVWISRKKGDRFNFSYQGTPYQVTRGTKLQYCSILQCVRGMCKDQFKCFAVLASQVKVNPSAPGSKDGAEGRSRTNSWTRINNQRSELNCAIYMLCQRWLQWKRCRRQLMR